MSTNDYQRVHNTRLSDLDSLPQELVRSYLATCSAPVRVQLLRTLIERRTPPPASTSAAGPGSPASSATASPRSDQDSPPAAALDPSHLPHCLP